MKKKLLTIALLIILIFTITGCTNKKYQLDDDERIAYTTLRVASAKSAYDESGEIDKDSLELLKRAVQKLNKNNKWFENYNEEFFIKSEDTNEYRIDYICNKNNCAKLTIKLEDILDFYLIDYSFGKENIEVYKLTIK